MVKINLGCGKRLVKGFINVDFEDTKDIDVNWNLEKIPYPFKDKQFKVVLMYNILEHLSDPYAVMKEIYRITKPGAKIHLYVPHFSSDKAWGDIQHKKGYSSEAFTAPDMSKMYSVKKLKIGFSRYRIITPIFANLFVRAYEKLFAYIFPASHLDVLLIRKG